MTIKELVSKALRLRHLAPYLSAPIVYIKVRDHKKGQVPYNYCGVLGSSGIDTVPSLKDNPGALIQQISLTTDWFIETHEVVKTDNPLHPLLWHSILHRE